MSVRLNVQPQGHQILLLKAGFNKHHIYIFPSAATQAQDGLLIVVGKNMFQKDFWFCK